MRVVVLSSSAYSETACATAVLLAQAGFTPVGALALSTLHRKTLIRKIGQWGIKRSAEYARIRLSPRIIRSGASNPYLAPLLESAGNKFRDLRGVAAFCNFPVTLSHNQNSQTAIAQLRDWSPDILVFSGGNILRKPLLQIPRLGVLNAHLGMLPEIRGMSSPEWSLLSGIPVGVTIHFMDSGIDTGPVLRRGELPDLKRSTTLLDLRNRLVAFGIEQMVEVVSALHRGELTSRAQSAPEKDTQFFVMHDRLLLRAADLLQTPRRHG